MSKHDSHEWLLALLKSPLANGRDQIPRDYEVSGRLCENGTILVPIAPLQKRYNSFDTFKL